jgi:hypothetical protein
MGAKATGSVAPESRSSSCTVNTPCCYLVCRTSVPAASLATVLRSSHWDPQLHKDNIRASSQAFHTLVLVQNFYAAVTLRRKLQQELPPTIAVAGLPDLASRTAQSCDIAIADVDSFTIWLQNVSKLGADTGLPASELPLWGLCWVVLWEDRAAAPAALGPAAAAAMSWPIHISQALGVLTEAVAKEGLTRAAPSYIFSPQVCCYLPLHM